MKILVHLMISTFLVFGLSGCVIVAGEHGYDYDSDTWESRQKQNREIISELELNSDRTQVVRKLGAPDLSEALVKGEDQYRVLYYRTQHRHSDGETSKDETTALVFKNEKLIGWGDEVLASIR